MFKKYNLCRFSFNKNSKNLINGVLIFCLLSCGGGGGGSSSSSSSTTSYTGVAVDGYLYLAKVFLDLNGNGSYDSGEPTTTTDSTGSYTLSATQTQFTNSSVVVLAIAGTTIDQDSPSSAITSGMTLIAPAGSPTVVSPLTTQVAAQMATGLSLSDAKSAVQSELGLTSVDVMKDYVSEKATNSDYLDAHKIAVSIAESLKTIDQQSSSSTSLTSKLSSLKTAVTNQIAPIKSQIKSASLDNAKNIYSIGGTISGLNASGLVLSDGSNTLSLNSSTSSFTFTSKKSSGSSYAVSVQSNPTGQQCTVTNGTGTSITSNISNIAIDCSYVVSSSEITIGSGATLTSTDPLIIQFNGQNGNTGVGILNTDLNTALTSSVWTLNFKVYPSLSNQSEQAFFRNEGGFTTGFNGFSNTSDVFFNVGHVPIYYESSSTLIANQWNTISYSRNNSSLTVSVNGVPVINESSVNFPSWSLSSIRLGGSTSGSYAFGGKIGYITFKYGN